MITNLGKVDIQINNLRYSYKLSFDRKISIILGDSGTGKTFLYNVINRIRTGVDKDTKVIIKSSLGINNISLYDVSVNANDFILLINANKNTIFFVDDTSITINKDVYNALLNSSNYCVYFSREVSFGFNFSSNAIYEFINQKMQDGSTLISQKELYTKYNTAILNNNNQIITEDSGEGLRFWQCVSKNAYSSNGNSNMIKLLSTNNMKNKFIVIDSEAAGNTIKKISDLCNLYNCVLFTPPCYEYLTMKGLNTITKTNTYMNIELENVSYNSTKLKSWENYCKNVYSKIKPKISFIKLITGRIDNIKIALQSVGCVVKDK